MKHRSDRSERWRWETNSQFLDWWGRNRAGWAKKPDRRTWQQSHGTGARAGFQARVCLPGSGEELLQARSFPFRVASKHSQRRWWKHADQHHEQEQHDHVASKHSQRRWWKPRRRQERADGSMAGRRGPDRRRHFRPPDWGVAPSLHLGVAPVWRLSELTGGTILAPNRREPMGGTVLAVGEELTGGPDSGPSGLGGGPNFPIPARADWGVAPTSLY